MSDGHELIETIRQCIEQLDDMRIADDVMSPHERIELYAAIEIVPRELAVLVSSLRHDAVLAMHDLDVPRKTILPTSHGGAVLGSRNVGRYEWNGYELCDGLAIDAVDKDTGELTRAVPVERLRAVLPACASERTTSSKWNAKAVEAYVPIERYRKGEPVYEDTIEIIPTMALDERES
jgi:hypothetical protein